MIPTIHDKTGNTKYGELVDCIKGIVIEERNGLFQAEVHYYLFSPYWDKLIRGNIIIADANDTLKKQKFRINKVSKPINGQITVKAKHISYDIARDMIEEINIENQSCEYALNTIFRNSQFSKHYKGYSDIINSQNFKIKSTKVLSAIAGTEGSIIDTYGTGAEILRDNENISVLNKRGHDNGVTIEYGKNLTGITLDEDDSSMITRIKGYAKYSNENGEEVIVYTTPKYIDSPRVLDYETPFVEAIDFSNNFANDEVPTPEKIKTLVEKYFTNNKCDLPKINAKISFIPLSKCVGYEDIEDKISLCDIVTIKDYRYNYETKAKVIKTTYNFLIDRYESMEIGEPRSSLGDVITNNGSQAGTQGPAGPPGKDGEDGNIEDFPDSLPSTPVLSSTLYGFANIELSWTFENKVYYSYELYASKIKDFTPNTFDLIFQGQASTFLFQAKPNETWYFRVCALNTHGKRTSFSKQISVTTVKVNDLSNYIENAAIGDALIGTLSLDRGWVGELRGNYIDAKQLSVTDGNGKRTLWIDSFGNVNLDVASLKINAKYASTTEYVDSKVTPTNNKVATIEINLNSLTSRVSSTETTVINIDGNVSKLANRINTAEQKITSTAILNAVNEQIGKGGAISTTSTKLEKGKFTIYNGALIVKNNKAKDVMWCNTEGWLTAANLFINGNENPSNLEIGGSNGNKGVGIRTNGSNYSAYLDFGVLDRNASFSENVRTGKYHRFITEASDRTMLNLVTPHFNVRPFDGYSPTKFTVQGYIEAFHDISTKHNMTATGRVTAGGFYKSNGYFAITSDTIDVMKHINGSKPYIEVRTPKSGTWGITIWASDKKLKENILKIDSKEKLNIETEDKTQQKIGLDLINNLNHYSYNYIEEFGGGHVSCGYVAQELQELNNDLVLEIEQEDGSTMLQPSVQDLIPNITLALKQQQKIIEDLKAEIEELKSKIRA